METKKESIKIRISKNDKDKLKELSNSANESLSAYILRKSLCEDRDIMDLLPQTVELHNLLNEIYREIEKSNDEQIKNRIKNILKNHKGDAWIIIECQFGKNILYQSRRQQNIFA